MHFALAIMACGLGNKPQLLSTCKPADSDVFLTFYLGGAFTFVN